MLVALLFVLTIAYQGLLLWRGRMIAPRLAFRARHLRWASSLWIGYAAPAVVGMLALGRVADLPTVPTEFLPLADGLGLPPGTIGGQVVALGLAGGTVLGLALTWWRARRGKAPWVAGDASTIMPASDADLWPAAALAVSAGVAEELFYRLWLPLIVALASGSVAAGLIVGLAAFAAMHRYQGWVGMIATAVGGAMLTALYLGSGALWLPIAAHALTDLNALVLRPYVSARIRRRLSSSAASRS